MDVPQIYFNTSCLYPDYGGTLAHQWLGCLLRGGFPWLVSSTRQPQNTTFHWSAMWLPLHGSSTVNALFKAMTFFLMQNWILFTSTFWSIRCRSLKQAFPLTSMKSHFPAFLCFSSYPSPFLGSFPYIMRRLTTFHLATFSLSPTFPQLSQGYSSTFMASKCCLPILHQSRSLSQADPAPHQILFFGWSQVLPTKRVSS